MRRVPALLLCAAMAQAQAAGLGRLFSTPEERARVDARRDGAQPAAGPDGMAVAPGQAPMPVAPPQPADAPVAGAFPGKQYEPYAAPPDQAQAAPDGMVPSAANPVPTPGPQADTAVTLNGVLRSSSGFSLLWLNRNEGIPAPGTVASGAWSPRLPSGRVVVLRPGQCYEQQGGRIKDVNE